MIYSTVSQFIDRAEPGESFIYFRGFLAIGGCNASVLQAVRRAYDSGDIDLVQRRATRNGVIIPAYFEYIAIKRWVCRPIPAPCRFADR